MSLQFRMGLFSEFSIKELFRSPIHVRSNSGGEEGTSWLHPAADRLRWLCRTADPLRFTTRASGLPMGFRNTVDKLTADIAGHILHGATRSTKINV